MARRPKTSPIEDFVSVVALLPWWACVGAALLSYLVLAAMAKPVVLTGIQPGQLAPVMTHAVIQGLAMVGQFVVPILCLTAAAVSVAKRQRRSSLVNGVAQSRAPDALDGMSWQEFELLVGEAFRLPGYEVTELGGEGPDGGVDLVLRKDREKFLVQCKQWKALKVGVATLREQSSNALASSCLQRRVDRTRKLLSRFILIRARLVSGASALSPEASRP